ncbi:tetratricopeptide repeat protein [candidate division FCPU426 bacterium]|nr:tetratricopeptide repeat protein [candidate division FCPU426 bacterium]
MPLAFSRRRREKRKRRWISFTVIFTVLFCAALYLYGSRIRISLHMNKGRTYYQQGNLDQALIEFNRVLLTSTNNPQAIDAIGLVYLAQGDLLRAEIKYEQSVKQGLKPNSRFNHVRVGYAYLTRGIYAPAELEFRHALDITPRDPEAHLGHALALHALGRLTDAIDAYRQSLSLNPDLKLAQKNINLAREELERGFRYYIYDRQGNPLARYPVARHSGRRYYPLAQYASHLIGYVSEEHGLAGLERALEPYLPGNVVTLTIDSQWQRAADQAMGWRKGSLVALNPKTGEILALINHPSFNPNRIDDDWKKNARNKNQPLKNRAFEGLYRPGSIFKLITAAAAIETDLDMTHIFPVNCTGVVRYTGQTFWCWQRHGRVDSLQAALDTSCNVAMGEVGFALGPDRLYEYSNKFGFGAPISCSFKSLQVDLSFPVAVSTAPMVEDNRYAIANRSCGLGEDIFITPLHAAMLAAVVANQGRMMTPFFIKEIRNIQGELLGQGIPSLLRTPITPETSVQLRDYMIDTVQHGISQKAQIKGIAVAGKTGTTGDSRQGLNGWFICFAPAENPQVALAVYAEKEGTGMDMAAPIARRFLESVLK